MSGIYKDMPTAFSGTLSGTGVQALSGFVVPTDMDVHVTTIGPHVSSQGPAGHLKLTNVGWIQFYNSTFLNEEAITPQIWINSEAEDVTIPSPFGSQSDHFAYWINPGTSVDVLVTY